MTSLCFAAHFLHTVADKLIVWPKNTGKFEFQISGLSCDIVWKSEIKYLFLKFENHNGIIKWWEWKFEKQPKLEDSQNKFETVNQASSVKWLTKPVLSTFQHAHSITVVLFTMYRQTLIKDQYGTRHQENFQHLISLWEPTNYFVTSSTFLLCQVNFK